MSYFQLSYICADCGASINYYLYTMNNRRCKRCATEYNKKEKGIEIRL